ncbi:LysR substrate-binding domain-containing protein [Dongshaea marina]|uniref:LysR substrate-binding domain-containing protein n=1 Tax=Dongshaea marina TaxID=2047966 RepID=UPI000D3E9B3C|nr:LysR substrate-binding domain-containing protein [Dongshaea marina]
MERQQQILGLLYTFEVTARLLSFSRAAEELFITQGAISHRIKKLEELLGFKLFTRLTRALELTPEGSHLLGTLSSNLRSIFEEIEEIRFNELKGTLYLGLSPAFASYHLMPLLTKFQLAQPGLDLRLRVKASALNFQNEAVDLAIYYGAGHYPDLAVTHLFDEELIPVCAPDYSFIPSALDSLGDAVLLHVNEGIDQLSPTHEWQQWLRFQGYTELLGRNHYQFNAENLGIQAALEGLGILMGRKTLLKEHLRQGRLIAPFKEAFPSGLGYHLVCPKEHQSRPRYQAFQSWLIEELNQLGLITAKVQEQASQG